MAYRNYQVTAEFTEYITLYVRAENEDEAVDAAFDHVIDRDLLGRMIDRISDLDAECLDYTATPAPDDPRLEIDVDLEKDDKEWAIPKEASVD